MRNKIFDEGYLNLMVEDPLIRLVELYHNLIAPKSSIADIHPMDCIKVVLSEYHEVIKPIFDDDHLLNFIKTTEFEHLTPIIASFFPRDIKGTLEKGNAQINTLLLIAIRREFEEFNLIKKVLELHQWESRIKLNVAIEDGEKDYRRYINDRVIVKSILSSLLVRLANTHRWFEENVYPNYE